MTGKKITRRLGWLMLPATAGLLVLAACSPATPTGEVPTGVGVGTEAGTSVLSTEAGTSAGTSAVSTEASTAVPSEVGTAGASTESSTAAVTEQSTSVATEQSTSEAGATAIGTAAPGGTAATTAQPGSALLIDNNKLIGLPIVDSSTNQAGTVADVLVDTSGTVKSVVIDLSGLSAAGTPSANSTSGAVSTSTGGTSSTPGASGTQATGSNASQFVAVDWGQFQADPSNNRLIYQGSANSLMTGQTFNEQAYCNGYVIPNGTGSAGSGGTGSASFAGLWRLGSALSMVNLESASGASLGSIQSVILDMDQGKALYAVLNVSSQANTTPGASSTSSAVSTSPALSTNNAGGGLCANSASNVVGTTGTGNPIVLPFTDLSVSTANAASATPTVMVQAPTTKIQGAPNLSSIQLPMWPQMAPPGWNSQINSYWGIAGQ